jgi:hypothetical protein
MTPKQLENYVNVATGKARVVRASKPLTTEERVANRLVIKNRAVRADMSQSQRRAAILRGCL